jgi:hypothetical protein
MADRTTPRIALAALLLLAPACATFWHGDAQRVEIATTPPGATALILPTGERVTTPATVSLPRRLAYSIRIECEGHAVETAYLDRVTSHAIAWNRFASVLIGRAIDYDTGAAFRLTPERIDVALRTLAASSARPETNAAPDGPRLCMSR